jgi:hypothetical protein
VQTIELQTSNTEFRGVATMTATLRAVECGSDVVVQHEDPPAALSPADNEAGTRMAPADLANLVEAG